MANNLKERIYKFDNIKLLAITLVVIGHLIDSYTESSDMLKSLFIFIYTFHMPLFVFISGLFQKRFSDTNRLKINKVAFYVLLGFLLKIINALSKLPKGESLNINFFGSAEVEWYMFVISMFMVLAYLVRKIHPAIILSVSFVLGCVSGYFDFINDLLYLSRFFVFMPIYFLGYYATPQLVLKIQRNYIVKFASGLSMLVYFIMCFRTLPLVYQLRRLFTGRNPYSIVFVENCGFQHRILCYAISLTLCMAVICFIPNIKIPILTNMGKNTLAVYFWHRPILHLLSATQFFNIIMSLGDPLYKLLMLAFPILLSLVLALDIFMKPLQLLEKLINKLKPVWCYVIIFAPFVISAGIMYKEILSKFSDMYSKLRNMLTN